MRTRIFLSILFILAVVTDQASKFAVNSVYNLYDSRPVIGNILRLYYIRNSGAAFGINFGNPTIMLVVTILVTILLVYLFLSGKIDPGNLPGKCAIVLVLSGAAGNLIDRIRMGEVIDFIDMGIGSHRWPTYNLADVYVTCGMIILIFFHIFQSDVSEIKQ